MNVKPSVVSLESFHTDLLSHEGEHYVMTFKTHSVFIIYKNARA